MKYVRYILWMTLTGIILFLFGGPYIILSKTKKLKPITKIALTIIIVIMGTLRIITLM